MNDLNSTMFYKVKFVITLIEPGKDLLWCVVNHIRNWQTKKWNRKKELLSDAAKDWSSLKKGGEITSSDRKTVKITSDVCYVDEPKNGAYWACKIIEQPPSKAGFAPRRWITEVGYEPIDEKSAYFSCVISYNDMAGFIGECEPMPSPSIPGLIKKIIDDRFFKCSCGIDNITIYPQEIVSGGWMPFWEKLQSEQRELPYIYISPRNNSENDMTALCVDPEDIAAAVGGNALVFYATNKAVTEEMNYFTPQEFACYNGMIRIYYPKVNVPHEADHLRHRYFHPNQIENMGASVICQILRRAFAQDVTFYDKFFRIDDCRTMVSAINRRKRLNELQAAHQEKLRKVQDESLSLAMVEEERRLEAEAEIDRLSKELNKLEEENYTLKQLNESYRSLARDNAALTKAVNSRLAIKEYPSIATDVVDYFEATFGDKIQFTDDARKTLKDCRIEPSELWKVFYALSTVMWELYFTQSGDIYKEFVARTGIKAKRGEGSMTRSDAKLMRQFVTEYKGESINIEAHITYGKLGQSIHFGFSNNDKKIIIGSCGEHKDIYLSGKRK